MSIFKSCDIRGVFGQDWDVEDAHRIGFALGTMVRQRDEQTIVVGGDCRGSTPELKSALIDGLLAAGTDVEDVGQVPTPLVYFAARQAGYGNIAIVTASHNLAKYNGVKFMVANQPAVPETVAQLQRLTQDVVRSGQRGHRRSLSIAPSYERWLADRFSAGQPGVPCAALSIIADTMHGAFCELAPRLLASRGYRVSPIRNDMAPDFRGIEPNPARDENLQALAKHVVQNGADVGIALDGDGDRVIFVDHAGRIVRPERIAVLLLRELFHRCTMVYDLKCASIVADAIDAEGGQAIMRPSGYGFIKAAMLQHHAELGVEVSGHHFYRELYGGDDGLFTALTVCNLLRQNQKSLAEMCAPIRWPAISPDIRLPFTGDTRAVLDRIADTCGGEIVRIDGVRAQYATEGWALARASITEPALTFRFEGRNVEQMRVVARRFLNGVADVRHQILEEMDD